MLGQFRVKKGGTYTAIQSMYVKRGGTYKQTLGALVKGSGSYGSVAALNLNFLTGTLDPRITFSRADATTCASYYNAMGLLTQAAANVPRFDYDPITLQPKGLLIEESRTNLLTYSQDFSNAAWTKDTNVSNSSGTNTAPDGTLTANTISYSASTTGWRATFQATSQAVSTTYTVSLYAKKSASNFLFIRATAVAGNPYAWFNLATGTVGTVQSGITSTSITYAGSGWYRCSITFTTGPSIAVNRIDIGLTDADGGSTATLGASAFVWGAQLEAGAFATSYIPTTAAAVTRAADSANMTGTNFSSWFNASAGTLSTEWDVAALNQTTNPGIASIDDSTTSNRVLMFQPSNYVDCRVAFSGASSNPSNATTITANTTVKSAIAYAAGSAQMAVKGVTGTAGSPSGAFVPNRLAIGGGVSLGPLNGHIRRLAYYNTRLSDAQLQGITT